MSSRTSSNRHQSVIGLGANLGERKKTLVGAVSDLSALGRILAVSSLYESVPVGPPQPLYLNAAVCLEHELPLSELLTELFRIETKFSRIRGERWAPRTLDLDILWSLGTVLSSDQLCIPHPELKRREFALAPLVEVAPDAADPTTGERYADLLARLQSRQVLRREPVGWELVC